MIGVVVQGTSKRNNKFNPIVYHRFSSHLSPLEYTVKNCLDSALIHRVVLTMPISERKMVQGLDLKGRFGRVATVLYYEEAMEDTLDCLYSAALNHSFDHVVRVHADCPLLPGWVVNDCVKDYMQEYSARGLYKNYVPDGFSGPGFEVDVMPFWWLADRYVNEDTDRDVSITNETVCSIPTQDRGVIGTKGESFVFDSISKVEPFEVILNTVSQGYDIGDIIMEYVDGGQQEIIAQQ